MCPLEEHATGRNNEKPGWNDEKLGRNNDRSGMSNRTNNEAFRQEWQLDRQAGRDDSRKNNNDQHAGVRNNKVPWQVCQTMCVREREKYHPLLARKANLGSDHVNSMTDQAIHVGRDRTGQQVSEV